MEIKSKKRIDWIDVLKGVTVLLVSLHHSLLSFIAENGSSTHIVLVAANKMNYLLGYARIPAFFLAAGLVMASLRGNKTKWFLTKRFPFMIWVIIIWTIISLLVEGVGLHLYPWASYPSFQNGYNFPVPFGNLWFIYALLFLSAFAMVIDNMDKITQVILSVILSVGFHLYLKSYDFEFEISKMLFHNLAYKGVPFFIAGFIFKTQIINLLANQSKVIAIFVFLFFVTLLFYIYIPDVVDYGVLFFRYVPITLFFVCCIVIFSRYSFINYTFKSVGKFSLEFFILHQFFIAIFYSVYSRNFFSFGYVSDFLFSIAFPIILCLLFIKCFRGMVTPIFFAIPAPIVNWFRSFTRN